MAVTAVAPKYQCAEITSSARGRGSCCPNARHAFVYPFVSSVFIGLPWPTNKAGSLVIAIDLTAMSIQTLHKAHSSVGSAGHERSRILRWAAAKAAGDCGF